MYLSEQIATPLTIGFLKPVILIPVASINHLTTAQLEAVLLHEMAHIKRHDYLVNIIVSMAELALFFNPFTRLLGKIIRKERENSCDDWVLQFQYNASEYAQALLRIASLQVMPVFAMAAAGHKKELLLRVRRMIGETETRKNYRKQFFPFFLITAMLAALAWLSPAPAGIQSPKASYKTIALTPTQTLAKKNTKAIAIKPAEPVLVHLSPLTGTPKQKESTIPIASVIVPPVTAPQSLAIAETLIETRQEPVVVRRVSYNLNIDHLVANINEVDIEKTMADVFAQVQLSDEDKWELAKISQLMLSQHDRELMKKELTEKQAIRLRQSPSPVVINVSFTSSSMNTEDARQLAKIKLAILKQLRVILMNKGVGTRN